MKKCLSIIVIFLLIFTLISCSSNDEEKIKSTEADIASENTTISNESERKFVEMYSPKNNNVVANVGKTDIKKSLIEEIKNQDSSSYKEATEETIKLVAIKQYVEQNDIDFDKTEYQTFYKSNSDIANSISNDALTEMHLSRDEFLTELNYLTDIIISESSLNKYLFQHVIEGDWIIDDEKLYEQYLNCVNDQKKFHNQDISYGEYYNNYQKFFDSYCAYIKEKADIIYY